jgi:hypothetical protein
MSFILKNTNTAIQMKVTTYGRKLLASGLLTFKKFALSDENVNYKFLTDTNNPGSILNITRPFDKNPDFKYYIKPSDSSSSNFTDLPPVTATEITVKNTAATRGFFTGNTTAGFTGLTTTTYVRQANVIVPLSGTTGSTNISLKQGAGFSFSTEPAVGDYIMVQWINPSTTGTTTNGVIDSNKILPYLFYKIQSKTGTLSGNTLSVTVDRNTPNFTGYSGGLSAKAIVYPGGDSINSYYGSSVISDYWNSDTLSFDNSFNVGNDDVPVWNLSIVYTEELAGKDSTFKPYGEFSSKQYAGFKEYVNTLGDSQKSLGIVHFTNNSVSNFYGEQFYSGSTVLDIPTVIWSKTSNKVGVKLKCLNTTTTKIMSGLNTPYYDLIADDSYNTVVGKVFINMKLVVIENEELLAAMSYKSNRNWTLPEITNVGNTLGTTTNPNIFTTTNQRLYVSYLFDNTLPYILNGSYGYKAGLHNQIYTVFSGETNGTTLTNNQVCRFNIPDSELQYLSNVTNFASGTGFAFRSFKIIYQLVNNSTDRPSPSAWKEFDYTSRLNGYSSWSGTTIPSTAFQNINYIIDNNIITGGTTYNLNNYINIPLASDTTTLNFGDEVFFYGNVNTDISATVFKTKFLLSLPYNNFNTSQNPTFDETENSVLISSIGIYDDNNVLVAVGKLSTPLEKKNTQTKLIELSLDF